MSNLAAADAATTALVAPPPARSYLIMTNAPPKRPLLRGQLATPMPPPPRPPLSASHLMRDATPAGKLRVGKGPAQQQVVVLAGRRVARLSPGPGKSERKFAKQQDGGRAGSDAAQARFWFATDPGKACSGSAGWSARLGSPRLSLLLQ